MESNNEVKEISGAYSVKANETQSHTLLRTYEKVNMKTPDIQEQINQLFMSKNISFVDTHTQKISQRAYIISMLVTVCFIMLVSVFLVIAR